MSVFDDKQDGTPAAEETIESYVQKLVETRGENWKDPETIAKGKYEADLFIEQLKRQNEELRSELNNAEKIDQLMEMIKNQNKSPDSGGGSTQSKGFPPETKKEELSEETLRGLIAEHVSQREVETTRQKNLNEVDSTLRGKYGDAASSVVRQRASELGMSVQEMQEMAAKTPKAFLKLVGADSTSTKESSVTVGNTQRSEGVPNRKTGNRDWNYYQELRRKNKHQYFASGTQQQMLKDLKEMGREAFYGPGYNSM